MTSIKTKIVSILPEKLKTIIRPYYYAAVRRFVVSAYDKPSTLTIDSFDEFEVAYRKHTADEDVIKHSFGNDIYLTGVPEYQPDEDHVIIDIGAHIGTFSLLASSKVRRGKVYAIEACQDTFNFLRINVALNQCDNIFVHHLAIADKEGKLTLYYELTNWGHTLVKELSRFSETVEASTLSTFLEKNQIEKCNFMKINIEGAEFPLVLSTPSDVLQRIDTILVMYHTDLWTDNTEFDLMSHLESSGFNCEIRNRETENRGWIFAYRNGAGATRTKPELNN